MNVQDATNLSINEGEVRTIHNSAGAQLWGKLNYNTLYKGNTGQDTTTGKNLLDIPDGYTGTSGGVTTTWSNNIATSNASSTTSSTCSLTSTLAFKSTTIPAGTYTFSVQSSTSQYYPILRLRDTSNSWHNYSITAGENSVTITTDYSANAVQLSLGLWTAGTAITNFVTEYPMLEAGSSATSYEPYTGEMPSPNPDYPQTVEVVTGEQTLSISGGTITGEFNIDLGTTELCKIGNYQDYIYQGNDGWYVHKATGKREVTSISSIYSLAGSGYIGAQFDVTDMASNSRMNGYCNILIPMNSPSGATTEGITFGAGNTYVYVILKDSRMASSTVANWNAWLASNTTIIYYPLATPTETKITDTTLINSLDAVQEWLTRYGYTYSVNGSLPIIIEQNSLT